MIKWFESNATKIIITLVIMIGLSINILYMQDLKGDINKLNNKIDEQITLVQDSQMEGFKLLAKGMVILMEELIDISDSIQYIIDQNREKEQRKAIIVEESIKVSKPTYAELKSHTVFIIGCSGKKLDENKLIYSIGDNGKCWSGTGTVVKITDNETYILTNNHVAGEGENKVTLYVENKRNKIEAEVIKHHPFVDLAVIKVNTKLEDKTAINKISLGQISEPIYIVGHPMGSKYIYTEGVVAGFVGISMFIQAPCIYGNSGSGVFNSKGDLIVLVYARKTYPCIFGIIYLPQITHALVVDGISIKMFLKDLGLYNE